MCIYFWGEMKYQNITDFLKPIWISIKPFSGPFLVSSFNLITKNLLKPVRCDWAFSDTSTIYEITLWGFFLGLLTFYLFLILYETRWVFLFSEKYIFSYFFVPRKFHQERVVLIEMLKYLNYHFIRHFGVSSNIYLKEKIRDIGILK